MEVVSADATTDANYGYRRHSLDLPAAPEDSVITVAAPALCDSALTAYRLQRFGADTGWLDKVVLHRVQNRYAVFGGEANVRGVILYVFDLSWGYKGQM